MLIFKQIFAYLKALFIGNAVKNSPEDSLTSENLNQNIASQNGCLILLPSDVPSRPPLMYELKGLLLMPKKINSTRRIFLANNEAITLYCPGVGNFLEKTQEQISEMTCTDGAIFTASKENVSFSMLSCRSPIKESLVEEDRCGNSRKGTKVLIGWISSTVFKRQILVCHNKDTMRTSYTHSTINGTGIEAKDLGNARPGFKKGSYFPGIDLETLYSQSNQKSWFNFTFGSELSKKYIDVPKNLYFARGHLTPEADFVYDSMQDATFYHINAAPQYQVFNNGNWKQLEIAVRELSAKLNRDLEVLTGTYGTLSLPDENGNKINIFLGKDVNGNEVIPAPLFFWKVVTDPILKQANAFIGLNNPFVVELIDEHKLCKDMWNDISLTIASRHDFSKGYLYCCKVEELRSAIPDIPSIDQRGLLRFER
ncbi:uncharacterized protein LOC136027020 [Artemia franciscana]|uniref:DNA/RNA non-specific endonuclease domain-containing protein n=1 Tax=Artemia franciscana TaxID=6661 RepID=A0AA88L1C2_ARTSF|nr:hypothetical protein QYM36_013432 [Artemia franciscana]